MKPGGFNVNDKSKDSLCTAIGIKMCMVNVKHTVFNKLLFEFHPLRHYQLWHTFTYYGLNFSLKHEAIRVKVFSLK